MQTSEAGEENQNKSKSSFWKIFENPLPKIANFAENFLKRTSVLAVSIENAKDSHVQSSQSVTQNLRDDSKESDNGIRLINLQAEEHGENLNLSNYHPEIISNLTEEKKLQSECIRGLTQNFNVIEKKILEEKKSENISYSRNNETVDNKFSEIDFLKSRVLTIDEAAKCLDTKEDIRIIISDLKLELDKKSFNPVKFENNIDKLNLLLEEKYQLSGNMIIDEKLGKGAFGTVNRVFISEKLYALKKIEKNYQNKSYFNQLCLKEIKPLLTMIESDHPKLLRIYKIDYKYDQECSILMEYGCGSLADLLNFMKQSKVIFKDFREVLQSQLLDQIDLLKQLDLCHRDINFFGTFFTYTAKYFRI
jgi:hypothetical protein